MLLVGTRPEAIKLAPVHAALASNPAFRPVLLTTGQHREMTRQVLDLFGLTPDIDLDIMQAGQALVDLSVRATAALGDMLKRDAPDIILVQGDTTSAMIGGWLGFYSGIPVGHVEAGLRTGNLFAPYPEEFNRRVISLAARWHFAPTVTAAACLAREGIVRNVHVVGNTVIDAALEIAARTRCLPLTLAATTPFLGEAGTRTVLITMHRRENFGAAMAEATNAIARLARSHPDMHFVLPLHPNPAVGAVVRPRLEALDNVHLVPPLNYGDLIAVMSRAFIVLTDSGGIQEEAPSFDVPILVLRNESERMEGVEAGCAELVGTNGDLIVSAFERLCSDPAHYRRMATAENPYGTGQASRRIAEIIAADLQGNAVGA